MKLNEFLESTYIKARQEYMADRTQVNQQARTKASEDLLGLQLFVLKWINLVHIISQFISVKLHISKPPLTGTELIQREVDKVSQNVKSE